jgi:CBS domain-containing protein
MSITLHSRLQLLADTAADLMRPNPVSLPADAGIHEALILFTEKGFTAAPVIDESGRPVGVLSQSDIIVHDRERVDYATKVPDYYHESDLHTATGEKLRGFQVEVVDQTLVSDLMTPAVFSVTLDTPSTEVIAKMLALKIHRLFVVDNDQCLVGIISALDILRHLRTPT